MRTWLRAVVTTPSATVDMVAHLNELIAAEDKLSKANTIDGLHYQRGVVDGLKKVLYALENARDIKHG